MVASGLTNILNATLILQFVNTFKFNWQASAHEFTPLPKKALRVFGCLNARTLEIFLPSSQLSSTAKMSMRDLINGEAELDDEENDGSFDEETGEPKPGKKRINGELDDSSEEEDDDDDEEAARAV